MPLWLAAVLLVLAAACFIIARRRLPKGTALRTVCLAVCLAAAVVCAVYIGLTALLLDAVRNRAPDL